MRLKTSAVIPLLGCAALAACHGRSRPPSPEAAEHARALAAADSALASPTPAPPSQAAAGLAGAWALRIEDQSRRGPLLQLALDSVTGSSFRVRVTFLMSGNLGIEPERFETTTGTVGTDGVVRFNVKMRDQTDPLGQLSGTMGRDTIRLLTFRWAGEDQTAQRTRWLLVKQPRP